MITDFNSRLVREVLTAIREIGEEVNGTKELLFITMTLDPKEWKIDLGSRQTNTAYVRKELKWYLSQKLNVRGHVDDVKIWKEVSGYDGEVNSNYGWCIFSNENGRQFENAFFELKRDEYSRRAVMIYTRPSMHGDWNKNGMKDFMCTDKTQVFIRNRVLHYAVHQRSCDMIFGFFNDFAWHCFVYRKIYRKLKKAYCDLKYGSMIYNIDSAHVYERHYELLKQI